MSLLPACKFHEGRDFGLFVHCYSPSNYNCGWYIVDTQKMLTLNYAIFIS